jgi:hypothetical protein
MKKINLKLVDVYGLEAELNGLKSEKGDELVKGLLNEKLSIKTKFWLSDLSKKVVDVKAIADKLREELIRKYGEADESGSVKIDMMVKEGDSENLVTNPNYIKFQEEFNSVLGEEREIEYKPFKIDDFSNVETNSNYNVFFKLIDVE